MVRILPHFSRYRSVIAEMLESVGSDRWRIFWIFPLVAVSAGIGALAPYLAKLETDQLVEQRGDFFGLITGSSFSIFVFILFLIFAINLVRNVCESFEGIYRRFLFERVESRFSLALVERLRYLEPGKLSNARVRSLVMDAVGGGYESLVKELFADTLARILEKAVAFAGLFATFALVDWRLGLVLAAAVALDYGFARMRSYLNKKNEIRQVYSQVSERSQNIRWRMGQDLDKLLSNHALPFIVRVFSAHRDLSLDIAREQSRGDIVFGTLWYVSEELSGLVMKMIVGYAVFVGTGSVGTMTMTVMAMWRLSDLLTSLPWLVRETRETFDRLEKLRIFYDFTYPNHERSHELAALSILECRDLAFCYPPLPPVMVERLDFEEAILRRELVRGNTWRRKEYEKDLFDIDRIRAEATIKHPSVLAGVNFRVERGETVAVIGSNGAGKTTLVETLMGFFGDYEGDILYDGLEGRTLSYDSIATQFSVIDQEPYLMDGFSIRDNLVLGARREIADSELWETLEAFGMKSVVERQYQGLDTEIGIQSDFSGGQRQLLVLARVFLQDRPVAIFDEGTNQLDAENEARVMRLLLSRRRDRINIFITHRISTIRDVARIYCLERGRIVATGTSAELLAAGDNPYARFVRIGSGVSPDDSGL